MLSFTPNALNDWLLRQPGGRYALERGLNPDVMPTALLAIERLAAALEGADQQQLAKRLTDPAFMTSLRSLATHLGAARRFRLVAWIAETADGDQALEVLLDPEAPPAGAGAALLSDIARRHRDSLLELIFDPARVRRIQAACGSETA